MRTRRCVICRGPFTPAAIGRPRRYCSDRCRAKAYRNRHRRSDPPVYPSPAAVAALELRLAGLTYREIGKHLGIGWGGAYGRVQRAVRHDPSLQRAVRECRPRSHGRSLTQHGYIHVHWPKHPLARRNNMVYEHRFVLYETLGRGPHRCAVESCGRLLDWPEIVVHHVNHRRDDNRLENLRACCAPCHNRVLQTIGGDLVVLRDAQQRGLRRAYLGADFEDEARP